MIIIWLLYLDYKVINDIMEIPLKQEGSLTVSVDNMKPLQKILNGYD